MVNIFISDAVTAKTARNRPAIWRVRTSLSEVCLYHSLIFIYSFICLFIYLLTYYSFNFPCFIQSFVCLICLINLLIRDLFIFTFFLFIYLFTFPARKTINWKHRASCFWNMFTSPTPSCFPIFATIVLLYIWYYSDGNRCRFLGSGECLRKNATFTTEKLPAVMETDIFG